MGAFSGGPRPDIQVAGRATRVNCSLVPLRTLSSLVLGAPPKHFRGGTPHYPPTGLGRPQSEKLVLQDLVAPTSTGYASGDRRREGLPVPSVGEARL